MCQNHSVNLQLDLAVLQAPHTVSDCLFCMRHLLQIQLPGCIEPIGGKEADDAAPKENNYSYLPFCKWW